MDHSSVHFFRNFNKFINFDKKRFATANLLEQCKKYGIPILEEIRHIEQIITYKVIVDALFGLGFKPPVSIEFAPIMDILMKADAPICSIDIPSGWNVNTGAPKEGGIKPDMLISLTAPKSCAWYFTGKYHYLTGRFIPYIDECNYGIYLPEHCGKLVIDFKKMYNST